ncbi:MAG: NYN domain-containing protein [Planctomycetota bacterium]
MLLVDGFNVLHVTGVLPPDLAGLEPADLAGLISSSRYRGRGGRIVLDGARPHTQTKSGLGLRGAPSGGPEHIQDETLGIVYAGYGKDADSLIERFIAESTAPKRLLVISSDRRIQRAARRRKAKWLPSGMFLEQLHADAQKKGRLPLRPEFAKQVPLPRHLIRSWIDEFGTDAEELIRAAGAEAAKRAEERSVAPAPAAGKTRRPRPTEPPPEPEPVDPAERALLDAAIEEWRGRLSLDDLDMQKWIDDHSPRGGSHKRRRDR